MKVIQAAAAALLLATPQLVLAQTQGGNPNASGPGQNNVQSAQSPQRTESMRRLMAAAQQLRESIQAMAQQPAGDRRNAAIQQANQALLQTQQAMVQLPPDLRNTQPYREAEQHVGEAQRSLQGNQPNTQQAQASVARALGLLPGIAGQQDVLPGGMRRSSQLVNKNLTGPNGNYVAEIEDLVIGSDWRVTGAVVEWGGFLGMGEKRAVIPVDRITFEGGANGRARLNMTQQDLERLPDYHRPNND